MHAFCHKLRNYSYVLTLIWVNMQYQYLNSQANFPCCYKTASQVKIIYSHVFILYSRIHNLQLYNISESLLTTKCLDIGFMYMYFLGTTLYRRLRYGTYTSTPITISPAAKVF